jgi:hypothetical protein
MQDDILLKKETLYHPCDLLVKWQPSPGMHKSQLCHKGNYLPFFAKTPYIGTISIRRVSNVRSAGNRIDYQSALRYGPRVAY